ncbi:MAG: class I SAM-dependent methyltransferase [Bacteroidota bacterium]
MSQLKGTIGYSEAVQSFVRATHAIPFEVLHQDFLAFIPLVKSLVVDIGAGIGRDAYELSLMGHTVIAIEPLEEFRTVGKNLYPSTNLIWMNDSLPHLRQVTKGKNNIDFVLCSGVWHHLEETEQVLAMTTISHILKPNGIFALSLRNGPTGVGTHIFSTDLGKTIQQARACGLLPLLEIENQPSLMKNKAQVRWSRLVLKKNRNE